MVRNAAFIWPISSVRPASCGSLARAPMLWLTCSADADSRRIGPAMVR